MRPSRGGASIGFGLGGTPTPPPTPPPEGGSAPTFGEWTHVTTDDNNITVTNPGLSVGAATLQMQFRSPPGSGAWNDAPGTWPNTTTPGGEMVVDNRPDGNQLEFRAVQTGAGGSTNGPSSGATPPAPTE